MARNKYPEKTIELILDTAAQLFTEKGFEKTSLQDIMDETHLSKGAIYHHFVSKDDIFIKICERSGAQTEKLLVAVRDDHTLSGREKFKSIIIAALNDSANSDLLPMQPYMVANPKFLAAQIESIFKELVPCYLQPILEEGVEDGSLTIVHPAQTAQMILMLGIWLNPLLVPASNEEIYMRCEVFVQTINKLGIEILTVDEMQQIYSKYNDMLNIHK